ncbi:hypothetical protein WDU94_002075, partial [Cyamophila willieti]
MADPATRDQPAGDQHRTVGAGGGPGPAAAAGRKRGARHAPAKASEVTPTPPTLPPSKRKTRKATRSQRSTTSSRSRSASSVTGDIELVNSALGGVGTAPTSLTRAVGKKSSSVAAATAEPLSCQTSKKNKKKSSTATKFQSSSVSAPSAENDTPASATAAAETGKKSAGKKKSASLQPFQGLLADVNCAASPQEVDSDTPLSDRLSVKTSPQSQTQYGVGGTQQTQQANKRRKQSPVTPPAKSSTAGSRHHLLSATVDLSVQPADVSTLPVGNSSSGSANRKRSTRKRKHSEPVPLAAQSSGRSLRPTEARRASKVSLSNVKIDTPRRNQPTDSQSQLQHSPAKKARPSNSSSAGTTTSAAATAGSASSSLLRRSSRCKLTTGSCAST